MPDAAVIAPRTADRSAQPTPPAVAFRDVTEAAGISHVHANGAYGERLLPETMGGGLAVLDYDADQAVDLLFVNGRAWPWRSGSEEASSLVLYRGELLHEIFRRPN